ncbi:predicted GPI-anchored protein 1 [Diutina catenulata]
MLCHSFIALLLGSAVAQNVVNYVGDDETTTENTSQSTTMVFTTKMEGGIPVAVQVAYFQKFRDNPKLNLEDYVQKGAIGMGSITGTYGVMRDYDTTTVTDAAHVPTVPRAALGLVFALLI